MMRTDSLEFPSRTIQHKNRANTDRLEAMGDKGENSMEILAETETFPTIKLSDPTETFFNYLRFGIVLQYL